ncbi:MAG: deoxyguanosinetriphosphate triphosphohydrolase, partial [Terriglobales bacterium]
LKYNEALKRMLDGMVGDLISNTRERVKAAGVRTLAEVRDAGQRLAAFSEEMDGERRECKKFLNQRLYSSNDLRPEKDHAERVVTELFEFWIARPQSLPSSYFEKARQESLPRVVCDYIAGMTDHYILEQHEKNCGARPRTRARQPR